MSDPQDQLRAQMYAQMRQAVTELGPPLWGLADPAFGSGHIAGTGGRPCHRISLLYRPDEERAVGVTTSLQPPPPTEQLANVVQLPAEVTLPWTVSVDELSQELAVNGDPQDFAGVLSSSGHWSLTGRAGERHVVVFGTPGIDLNGIGLVPVQLDLGDGTRTPLAR